MDILNTLYTTQRTRSTHVRQDVRNAYQKDYDRIIFSSAFRRLQNKTQVFPLPGSVFVHNRLTHSLEVASIGRTLGFINGNFIADNYATILTELSQHFFRHGLQSVIASASLCHDIGNPAFGHSGEDAIALYFIKNKATLNSYFSEAEWCDFENFEGNANAFRLLTQHQQGKLAGGLDLTFTTLMSIAKYPCESLAKDTTILHRKKFGCFQKEKMQFKQCALSCKMMPESESPMAFRRHPFVWLTEAADDIAYSIIDLEDAHRLGLISSEKTESLLIQVLEDLERPEDSWKPTFEKVLDANERIAYLRAMVIGGLIQQCCDNFQSHIEAILYGYHSISLLGDFKNKSRGLKEIQTISIQKIYNNKSVLQIENAGYHVMYQLLDHFVPPILKSSHNTADKTALKLIPKQFFHESSTPYEKVLGIIDFVSGMTDNYATDLFRKIQGIDMGMSF